MCHPSSLLVFPPLSTSPTISFGIYLHKELEIVCTEYYILVFYFRYLVTSYRKDEALSLIVLCTHKFNSPYILSRSHFHVHFSFYIITMQRAFITELLCYGQNVLYIYLLLLYFQFSLENGLIFFP